MAQGIPQDEFATENASESRTAWPVTPRTVRRTAVLCLLLAVATAALVTCRFAPRIVWWRGLALAEDLPTPTAEFDRAVPSLAQLDNPWAPVTHPYHKVIQWRLLFPLLGHYLHLSHGVYLVLPHVGCLLALWLVAWLTYQRLGKWWPTWVATALFAALPWFFVSCSWLTHFDSWLICGLLIAAFVPSRAALYAACLLSPWVDERFVLCLPATLAVRSVALRQIEQRRWREMWHDSLSVAAALAPYLLVRLIAWLRGDPNTSAYLHEHWTEVQTVPWTRFLIGIWSGYRVGWLVIAATLGLVVRRLGGRWGAAFALVILATILGGLFIAWDLSRSMMMISPAFLLGMWLWEEGRPRGASLTSGSILSRAAGLFLPAVLVANLIVPAYHVLWFVEWPVEPLYVEVNKWRDPPHVLAAVQRLREARQLKEAGNLPAALANFDAAIDAERLYPQAYVERGMLLLQMGDYGRSEADINEALRLLPEYPFALLMRGVFRTSHGDKQGAAEDLQHAMAISPPDWPYRDEAQRRLAELRQ